MWSQVHSADLDIHPEGPSSLWTARLETSLTDPAAGPDPRLRRTEIVYQPA